MINEFKTPTGRRPRLRIFILILSLLLVLGGAILLYASVKINSAVSKDSVPVTFSVPKGSTTRDVASELSDNNLISSEFFFLVYAYTHGANGKIQAGDYLLDKKMNMSEILDTLTSGKVTRNEKTVTIVEGATNAQVEKQLIDRGLVTESRFDAALRANYDYDFAAAAREYSYEGFLFPDTYKFNANYTAEDIVERMLANFDSKFTDQMVADMQRKNLTMEKVVIMASIIEREVGRSSSVRITDEVRSTLQDEREKVASVFYNRLEIGMPLQSDATVNYATGKSDRRARFEDLETDSPYNTYKNAGLTPGPISNPGIGSIMAAIYPDDTDFLYFLSSPEGVAYFGRTLEEHNSNRAKYLE